MPDSPFWDSPFWEEQLALVRSRVRARTLMLFANARGLTLPTDAEQRLEQMSDTALGELINQAFTSPDAAATALLAAIRQR